MAIITVENITYDYGDLEKHALDGLSLEIERGEFLALVGHNGSGKSTLAKHLNGLCLPTRGRVIVDGMDTADETQSLNIKRTVGVCFQNPDNQIVTTVVEDDVAFGPENLGFPPDEIRKRVDDALLAVGMTKYAQSAPHMLSGGQKQRIAIAGLLAIRPKVLVLDEATAMLDPAGRREVLAIARVLNKNAGITVVMITQYMEEVLGADRVVVLSHGRAELVDTPERVFAQSGRLKSLGLDVPATVAMRNRLIAAGMPPTSAITVDDLADAISKFAFKSAHVREDT